MRKEYIKPGVPFDPSRFTFSYAWVILGVGIIGFVMSAPGQTIGVSSFTDYLIEDYELTRNQLSMAYMGGTLISGLLVSRAGKLYDIYGARIVGILSAVMIGLVLVYLTRLDFLASSISHTLPAVNKTVITIVLSIIGFFTLRFFGQGMLTMTSRNMIMKWFENRRGLANGFLGVFVAFSFSIAPQIFNGGISAVGWRDTWVITALIVGIGVSLLIFVFYRDNPKQCKCYPDGTKKDLSGEKTGSKQRLKDFTLKEALKTYSFWVFNLSLAMHALIITALTFHIASIFEVAGMSQEKAVSVFLPGSIISIVLNFGSSWLSDFTKLKYLLIVLLTGLFVSLLSIILLKSVPAGYWMVIIGYGISMGLFSVLSAVTWPRFFGIGNLGSISGYALGWAVVASSIGPYFFSLSYDFTSRYTTSALICLGIVFVLIILSFKAENVNRESETEIEIQ
ncbi:MAG: MFS transporter [Bacteroidales bacterium]